MLSLVQERINRPDCRNGFILDGYPRNKHQAEQLQKALGPDMQICVLEISAGEEEIVKRVSGRRTCPQCDRIYNVYFRLPQNDERCDFDGMPLFRRNDDSEEVVRRRIETYRTETYPLIAHYKELGALRVIDGLRPEEEVAEDVASNLSFCFE